jgi:tetratricopeptide (TPR) repeat protein
MLLMGNYLAALGRYDAAIAAYTGCTALEPRGGTAYTQRGIALAKSGQHEEALADFKKAAELWEKRTRESTDPGYRLLLAAAIEDSASSLRQLGRFDDAREAYRRALDIQQHLVDEFPNTPWCQEQLAEIANDLAWLLVSGPAEIRDAKKALVLAQKAVQADPKNSAYLNTLGVVYYRLDRYPEAIETLTKSVGANQEGGSAMDFFFLGMAHQRLGHADEAGKQYARALEWVKAHPQLPPQMSMDEVEPVRREAEKLLKEE